MTSKATGTSNGHRDPCTKCSSKNPAEANGGPIANGVDSCQHTQHNSDNASKVVHKLHQLEVGQRKIIQLLTSIEKELSAREKLCCSKHYLQHQQGQNATAPPGASNSNITSNASTSVTQHIHQGWVREEDSGQGNGERLVKIHLQDATTSTKHVGFRIDKSCQTVLLVNGGSSTPVSSDNVVGDQEAECSCCKNGHDDKELIHLREELKKATHALSQTMAVKTTDSEGIDFGAESPLNLFIQCFKEKYGLVVNPNDVAIFV